MAAPIGAASRSPALARARLTTALAATTTRAPDSAKPRGLRIGLTGRRAPSADGPCMSTTASFRTHHAPITAAGDAAPPPSPG